MRSEGRTCSLSLSLSVGWGGVEWCVPCTAPYMRRAAPVLRAGELLTGLREARADAVAAASRGIDLTHDPATATTTSAGSGSGSAA